MHTTAWAPAQRQSPHPTPLHPRAPRPRRRPQHPRARAVRDLLRRLQRRDGPRGVDGAGRGARRRPRGHGARRAGHLPSPHRVARDRPSHQRGHRGRVQGQGGGGGGPGLASRAARWAWAAPGGRAGGWSSGLSLSLPSAAAAARVGRRCRGAAAAGGGGCSPRGGTCPASGPGNPRPGRPHPQGAAIGDVFVSTSKMHHDRRIPLPGFDKFGLGSVPSAPTPRMQAALGLKPGVVTSGDSLDYTDRCMAIMVEHGAAVKEMEAGSIAWAAGLFGKPVLCIKAITVRGGPRGGGCSGASPVGPRCSVKGRARSRPCAVGRACQPAARRQERGPCRRQLVRAPLAPTSMLRRPAVTAPPPQTPPPPGHRGRGPTHPRGVPGKPPLRRGRAAGHAAARAGVCQREGAGGAVRGQPPRARGQSRSLHRAAYAAERSCPVNFPHTLGTRPLLLSAADRTASLRAAGRGSGEAPGSGRHWW